MATDSGIPKEDFGPAQANLRDTVKWLATIFAALAAFVVGGTSINNLGEAAGDLPKFGSAVACLLVGFLAICWAVYQCLDILRPMLVYRSSLFQPKDEEEVYVQQEIDAHAADLLPHNYKSLAEMRDGIAQSLEEIASLEAEIEKGVRYADRVRMEEEIAEWKEGRDELIGLVDEKLGLAIYLRLRRRFDKALIPMFMSGMVALVALVGFAVLSHEKKAEDKKPQAVMNFVAATPGEPGTGERQLPPLASILFATGSAEISNDGMKAIEAARDALRLHPGALLLIRARTDTVAPMRTNIKLAQRRAAAVRAVLLGVGGVSASRVFLSELPEADLPALTKDESPNAQNRSVEVLLVAAPTCLKEGLGPCASGL